MADDISVVFGANIAGLVAGVAEARESIEGLRAPVDSFISSLSGISEALGAAFAVEKIREFATEMAELGEKTANTAYLLGTSVGDYAQLVGALTLLGGNADNAQRTLELLGQRVQRVAEGNKTAAAAFHNLGISTAEVNTQGKDLIPFLSLVIERFSELEPAYRNIGLLREILGRGADNLAAAFRSEGEGWKEALAAAETYAAAVAAATAGEVDSAEKQNALQLSLMTLAHDGFGLLKPVIDEAVDTLDSWVKAADEAVQSAHDFSSELDKTNIYKNFISEIRDVIKILNLLGDTYDNLMDMAKDFGDKTHTVFLAIKEFIVTLFSTGDIEAAYDAMMKRLVTITGDRGAEIMQKWAQIKAGIDSLFGPAKAVNLPDVTVRAPRTGGRAAGTESGKKSGGDAAKKDYEAFAAEMRLEIAEADKDWDQISAIYQRWADRAKAQFGATSKEFREVLLAMTRAYQQHVNQMFAESERGYSAMKSIDDSYLKAFEENMKAMAKSHQISREQQYGFDIQYLAKLHDQERKRLEDIISNDQFTVEQKTRVYQQLLELDARYTAQLATLHEKMIQNEDQEWQSFFNSLGSQFTGLISGMATGGETLRQGLKKVFDGILNDFIKLIGDMVAKWAAMQLSGGATSSLSTALADMMGGVGVAGSGGGIGSILGGLPIIGGLFGGGLSAGAAGAASGFGGAFNEAIDLGVLAFPKGGIVPSFANDNIIPSAKGGWAIPSFQGGGLLAQLHSGEMVLPRDLSEGVQGMIRSGGGGGGGTINIHAMDTQTGAQFLMKNRNTVGQAFRQASLTGGMSARQLSNGRGSTGRF